MFMVRVERKKCQFSQDSEAGMGLQKESRGCRDGGCEMCLPWVMAVGKLSVVQPPLGLGLKLELREGLREGWSLELRLQWGWKGAAKRNQRMQQQTISGASVALILTSDLWGGEEGAIPCSAAPLRPVTPPARAKCLLSSRCPSSSTGQHRTHWDSEQR